MQNSSENTISDDDYVLSRTSEEYRRLRIQSLAWEKATEAIFNKIELSEGLSCLDIGCGPGEVMRLMGQHVGKTGSVVGVDTDGKIGREALSMLRSKGQSNFDFVEGDFQKMNEYFSGKQYDLVYSRFLLIHMNDHISSLKKMYQLVRPKGYLVIQDYDFRTLDEYPVNESMEEVKKVFFGVMEKSGRDIRIGSKLPYYFIKAGIGAPDGVQVDGHLSPRTENEMGRETYKSVFPLALKLGLTTEEKYKSYLKHSDNLKDKESHYILWPLCIGVYKKRQK